MSFSRPKKSFFRVHDVERCDYEVARRIPFHVTVLCKSVVHYFMSSMRVSCFRFFFSFFFCTHTPVKFGIHMLTKVNSLTILIKNYYIVSIVFMVFTSLFYMRNVACEARKVIFKSHLCQPQLARVFCNLGRRFLFSVSHQHRTGVGLKYNGC